ncbi:MAG: putative DNA binding domain-containing protein [Candidatus Thermoplasmatota archaeon]|nr:putative DNA binding domain-containing protein [Candidatus Thermoplasmatota archaeon]
MTIKNLIKSKESQILEFKSKVSDKDNIGKDICAFANTNDGTILVGISDRGELFGVVKDTAHRDIIDLLDKGIILKRESGKNTYYVLSDEYRTNIGRKGDADAG